MSFFLRSHLTAALAGTPFAFFCGLVSVALLPFPAYVILIAPFWGLLFYTLPTCLGIMLVRILAKRLGPYDLFAILAGILALALSFAVDFASSIRSWLTSRGGIHGTLLGPGPPPEDIGGWILRGISLAFWIGLMVAVGIAWKRRREAEAPITALTPGEVSRIFFWLSLDSVVIGVVTFAILHADLRQRRVWSSPDHVFAREVSVLQDKDASEGDRALALNTISHFHNDQATDLLREAVRKDSGTTRLNAAAGLIGRDDLLALSVLEDTLMSESPVTGAVLPTTDHTPSEGNGVHVAGFGSVGPLNFGNSVASVKNPAAVPILIHLMASPNRGTREGAAAALRHIASPAATDALIKGLDDSDEKVRYLCVTGLAAVTHQHKWYVATSLFEDDEAYYIDHWKRWAKSRNDDEP
jgi:hypothetical protein